MIYTALHPLEVRLLLHYDKEQHFNADAVEKDLLISRGQCNQAISWLSAKHLIQKEESRQEVLYKLTELGAEYVEKGVPEERVISALKHKDLQTIQELADTAALKPQDVGSAFGGLMKAGVVAMDEEKRVVLKDKHYTAPIRLLLTKIIDGVIRDTMLDVHERKTIAGYARKRGSTQAMFRIIEHETTIFFLSESGTAIQKLLKKNTIFEGAIGTITADMLKSGSWKNKQFRKYEIDVPPSRVLMGRRNPYTEYLDTVKDKLVSLGFEEFDGPLVETEFWNSDALFMPQFHSARDIHDVYYVKNPTHESSIEEPYFSQVAAVHENGWKTGSRGWGYSFDREFTRRLILRSQGTVMSAKTLPAAKVPGKYFGVLRCFRYDQVDATHLSDFYQTEGIVLGENVTLKTLLGLLKIFAEELAGASEVRYVPGYFPFTEPSVEVHIRHPRLGWFELGGGWYFSP